MVDIINSKNLLKDLKNESIDHLSYELFKKLQKLSEQKGGFNSLEIQRQSFLRLANMSKRFNIYDNNHPSKIIKQDSNVNINHDIENEISTLKKDIPRCIYNQFIKDKSKNQIFNLNLDLLENKIANFLNNEKYSKIYSYYQGVLDVAVYFFLLYKKQTDKSIKVFHYFLEFYLKDYISAFKSNGDIFQNTVIVLSDFIHLINPKIGLIFYEDNVPLCICLSWIITTFCHDISHFKIIQRIMDYIFFHEPCVIFIIVSFIIIDKLENLEKQGIELCNENILPSLSQFNLEVIDFDDIIMRTQNFFEKNEKEIMGIQIKNKQLLYLIGDVNFKGSETIVNLPFTNLKISNSNIQKSDFNQNYNTIYTCTSLIIILFFFLFYYF